MTSRPSTLSAPTAKSLLDIGEAGLDDAADVLIQDDADDNDTYTPKIVVAGTSNGDFAVARFNTDGSLDDASVNDLDPSDSFGSGLGYLATDFGSNDTAVAVGVQDLRAGGGDAR